MHKLKEFGEKLSANIYLISKLVFKGGYALLTKMGFNQREQVQPVP